MQNPCENCPEVRDECGVCIIDGNCSKREDYLADWAKAHPPTGVWIDGSKLYGWWDNPDHPTKWEQDYEQRQRPRTI